MSAFEDIVLLCRTGDIESAARQWQNIVQPPIPFREALKLCREVKEVFKRTTPKRKKP